MASNLQVAIELLGKNSASPAIDAVTKGLHGIGTAATAPMRALGGLGTALGGIASIAGGFVVGQGILALPGALMGAAKAAADDEQATQRLQQSIKNLGGDFDAISGKVNAAITSGQKLAFTDDEVRDSFQFLAAATGDADTALSRQKAAMDLARGANIPLSMATKMLGKLNEENVEVFKKLGITLGDTATEADALAAVQAKFGGQSEAYANSTKGQFEQAQIAIAETQEALGAALLPVLAKVGMVLADNLPMIQEFVGTLASGIGEVVGPAFEALADTVGSAFATLAPHFQTAREGFETVKQVFAGDWSADESINPVVNAIGQLAVGFRDEVLPAAQRFGDFLTGDVMPAVQRFGELLVEHKGIIAAVAGGFAAFAIISTVAGWVAAGTAAFAALSVAFTAAAAGGGVLAAGLAVIGGPITLLAIGVAALAIAWQTNFLGIQDHTAALWAFVQPIIQAVIAEVGRFTTEMLPLAVAAWTAISSIVVGKATELWNGVQTVIGALTAFWTEHHATIEAVATAVWNAISSHVSTVWGVIQGVIKAGLQVLSGDWTGAWTTIQETVTKAWDGIKATLSGLGETLGPLAKAAGAAIVTGIGNGIATLGETLRAKITEGIRSVNIDLGWIRINGATGVSFNIPNPLVGGAQASAPAAPTGGQYGPGGALASRLGQFGPAQAFGPAPIVSQVQYESLSGSAAYTACGPAAAIWFANTFGFFPDAADAKILAQKAGWTGAAGMGGVGAFRNLASSLGVSTQMIGAGDIDAQLAQGRPVSVSTAGHYFQVAGGSAATGYNVGSSGTVYKGGSATMTLADMERITGPINGIIVATNNLVNRTVSEVVAPSIAEVAAPVAAPDWTEGRAAAFKGLFEEMQTAPASATEAITRMSAAFPELQGNVAAGSISLQSLAGQMVTVARNAGLNTEAFDRWSAGALDAQSALEQVVISAAAANPQFQTLLDQFNTAGGSSAELALGFLNLVAAQQAASAATAPAAEASGELADQQNAVADSTGNVYDIVRQANEVVRDYQNTLSELSAEPLAIQADAWGSVASAVGRAVDHLREYAELAGGGEVPEFHTGGRSTRDQLAWLQAGETVLTEAQARQRYGVSDNSRSVTINVYGGDRASARNGVLEAQFALQRAGLE